MQWFLLILVIFTSAVVKAYKNISSSKLWAIEGVRGEVISKATRLELATYETSNLYDLMQRVNMGIGFKTKSITDAIVDIIVNIFSVISLAMLLITGVAWLPMIMLVASVPLLILFYKQTNQSYNLLKQQAKDERVLEYHFQLITERQYAKEIKIFGLGEYFIKQWQDLFNKLKKNEVNLLVQQKKHTLYFQLLSTLSITLSIVYLVYVAYLGGIKLSELIVFFSGTIMFQKRIEELIASFANLRTQLLFAVDLKQFLDYQEERRGGIKVSSNETRSYEIRFDNVSFKYPHSNEYILKNISFDIKTGEKVAIIGENGAGKSSIIKLLLGIYFPTRGNIYINGINIVDIDLEDWRKEIGCVLQDFVKYQFSVRENIEFGNLERQGNISAVIEASKNAKLHQIVSMLPKQYETRLGKSFEDGHDLSGGQWQKVAISRAFFRDFNLLIFDEPTSAMDPRTEIELFKTFNDLSEGKTAIFVTHRLSTTRFADQIIVVKQGEIIEKGTQTELMSNPSSFFKKMYDIQAELYQEKSVIL